MAAYEMNDILIEGTFIRELKGRFSCEVMINDTVEKCYVPSSAKLENFIDLKNRKVLLTVNSKTSKTKYTLWSVIYKRKQILLNLKKINEIMVGIINDSEFLKANYDSVQREKIIENYKCDLLLLKDNVTEVIEIKTVISTEKKALFPGVNTKRASEQLLKLQAILKRGYKVKYIIVSLSPFVANIEINDTYKEYKLNFSKCTELGMEVIKLKLVCKEKSIFYERL